MKRLLTSIGHGVRGIGYTLRTQPNMRIHLLAAIVVAIAGIWLKISAGEWFAVIVAAALVTGAELFNTAIESLCDAVHPGQHPLIGHAKDTSAGAVLVASITAALIGLIVFGPKFWELFVTESGAVATLWL